MFDRSFIIGVSVCAILVTVACLSEKPRIRSFGPEIRADLVIFFKQDVTHQQIEDFWLVTLSKPDVGRGHDHRDGVSDIARIDAVQGHEGISVSYFANASQAQKEAVEKDVRSATFVYKILKDTVPAEVKNLE